MNIQAVLSSFILAIGAVMICVTTRTIDDDGELKGTSNQAVKIIGIVMTCVGGCGYLFTIYEVIRRGHKKLAQGELRKLEQQVAQRKTTLK
ncbi:unnamed protein product [Auanema sp. JU1783]|nr:unnamed protein product [Auanema sp. JU1783]